MENVQELHPKIDADKVIEEVFIKFRNFHGAKYKNIKTFKNALFQLSSKDGILTFGQEFTELNKDKAVKKFYDCPHISAFKELGYSDEEIEKLCVDMLNQRDFARLTSHPNVELSFPAYLSRGEKCCEMTFTKVK